MDKTIVTQSSFDRIKKRFSVKKLLNRSTTLNNDDQILQKKQFRVVFFGDTKVGKTSIIHQFSHRTFDTKHHATVEDLYHADLNYGSGKHFKLEILDTSGNSKFPAMRQLAISQGDGFVLVYDNTNVESFQKVLRFRREIQDQRLSPGPIVIVCNKTDLDLKAEKTSGVMLESVIDLGDGVLHTSAKNNVNITKVFKEVFKRAKMPCALIIALDSYCCRLKARPSLTRQLSVLSCGSTTSKDSNVY